MSLSHRLIWACVLGFVPLRNAHAGNPRFQETTSPDGRFVAFVNAESGDSEIFVESADGTNRRQLTDNAFHDNAPSWSPDGKRIAFESDRGGRSQIYVMDRDGQNVTQISNKQEECVKPKFGPQGQIAYLALQGRTFKRNLYNLVIKRGDKLDIVKRNAAIWDFAWHPESNFMGYSTDGEFTIHNLGEGNRQAIRLGQIDERLRSHGAFDCRWSPEHKAFLGRLRFIGGVPEGTNVYGDEEWFLFSLDGKARFLNSGANK